MKIKRASTTIYIVFFFVMFLVFSAFAVDASIILNQRVKLQNITEQSALAGASYFNSSEVSAEVAENVEDAAEDTFKLLKQDSIKHAAATVSISSASKMVLVESTVIAQPIFLSFMGVSGVNLAAKACAKSSSETISANYGATVKWLTPKALYYSSVVSSDDSVGDSAIVRPMGGYGLASLGDESLADYTLISGSDTAGLSLGPGGYVTIKLTVPVIDKSGNDLYIKEIGSAKEGYSVFAGLDVEPLVIDKTAANKGPYVTFEHPGAGIKWVNITCTGVSDDDIPAPITSSGGGYTKIYGSAYFDIGKTCTTHDTNFKGVSMVKYIRIVDDNEESAYFKTGASYHQAYPLGEAATATAGADIAEVKALNFVSLIPAKNFTP